MHGDIVYRRIMLCIISMSATLSLALHSKVSNCSPFLQFACDLGCPVSYPTKSSEGLQKVIWASFRYADKQHRFRMYHFPDRFVSAELDI
jgi:hypothetical protein